MNAVQVRDPSTAEARQSAARPSPLASPLLGFLARVPAGGRYAIYPLGRYSRAAFEDMPTAALKSDGRAFAGFIDDHAIAREWNGHKVLTLEHAAREWDLDAILLLRDTCDGALQARLRAAAAAGEFRGVRVITQPAPTVPAMLAHLDTYSPSCAYEPEFAASCRSYPNVFHVKHSTLALTLDAEVFPWGQPADVPLYGLVMREFCRILTDCGASASLCVQVKDSPGQMRATPPDVVHAVLDQFGPEAIELHGFDHAMPSDEYSQEWFERGLAALRSRYGVKALYWAPPGWTLCWRTLRELSKLPIRYVRGVWSGVNVRQDTWAETFRSGYGIGVSEPVDSSGLMQIPYCYADWMFVDVHGRRGNWDAIVPAHKALAAFAARGPCLLESVAHPFRLVGPDWRERLAIVRDTLELTRALGVEIQGVRKCLTLQSSG